jgi:putative DNA primase/helicase
MAALGLSAQDLCPPQRKPPKVARSPKSPRITLKQLAEAKGLPASWLAKELGWHDLPRGGVGIPYRDYDSQRLFVKRRVAEKAKDGSFYPKGITLVPYGLEHLSRVRDAGYLVLVEGETDVATLRYHEFPVLGLPGATTANCLQADHLAGNGTLFVWHEPDQGGTTFIQSISERLKALGYQGQTSVIRMNGVKDPNELHLRDAKSFKVLFQRLLDEAEPLPDEPPPPSAKPSTPYSDLYNAEALVAMHGSDLRSYEPWSKWLTWEGTRWDVGSMVAMQRAKATVKAMATAAALVNDDVALKALLHHIKTSLSARTLHAMVDLAASEPPVLIPKDMQLDQDPWLINCLNGTIDLRTGQLRPHRREDLITRRCPTVYDAHATCLTWMSYLNDVMAGNQKLIDDLQRATGYSLTGSVEE